MELTLLGTIQAIINGNMYEIIQDDKICVYNEGKKQEFDTLPKAITYLRSIQNELNRKERELKPKNESVNIKTMQLNDVKHFDVNLIKLIRPLLIYYRNKYGREFKSGFEYIDGIRKFKLTRIK